MNTLLQWLDKKGDKPFPNMMSEKATDVCASFTFFESLPESLKGPELTTEIFLRELINKDYYADALQFIAHGLEKHEAILWAYKCVNAHKKDQSPKLDKIKQWLEDPTEEGRLQCNQTDGFDDPLTWLSLAVFWSGGNISTQPDVTIESPTTLSATGVAMTLILSVISNDPEIMNERYADFLKRGIEEFAMETTSSCDVKEIA